MPAHPEVLWIQTQRQVGRKLSASGNTGTKTGSCLWSGSSRLGTPGAETSSQHLSLWGIQFPTGSPADTLLHCKLHSSIPRVYTMCHIGDPQYTLLNKWRIYVMGVVISFSKQIKRLANKWYCRDGLPWFQQHIWENSPNILRLLWKYLEINMDWMVIHLEELITVDLLNKKEADMWITVPHGGGSSNLHMTQC